MDRRQEIEKLAYDLFQRDGCLPGKDVEHWLEAEQIIRKKYAAAPEASVKPRVTANIAKPAEKTEKPAKMAEKAPEKKIETKESKPSKKAGSAKEKTRKAGNSRKEATL